MKNFSRIFDLVNYACKLLARYSGYKFDLVVDQIRDDFFIYRHLLFSPFCSLVISKGCCHK